MSGVSEPSTVGNHGIKFGQVLNHLVKNDNTFTVLVASFTRSGECSTTPLDESLHDGRKARFNKTGNTWGRRSNDLRHVVFQNITCSKNNT